jgi:hypothetical protein
MRKRALFRLFILLALPVYLLACTFPGVTTNANPSSQSATASPSVPTSITPTRLIASPTPTFRPVLTQRPLVWFGPLPPMPTGPGRSFTGSDDFMSLFKSDSPWQTAASHIQVFKLYGEWVAYNATDAQLRQVVADLNQRSLALAVEAGPLTAPGDCGMGVESFAGTQEGLKIARRILTAGGTIHLIALDEPYYFGHFYDGPNACHWAAEKIAGEVGKYIQAIRSVFPEVIVGDTEPLTGAANAKAYEAWLNTFLQVNGYNLAFLHMDVDWSNTDWPQEVKAIEEYGRLVAVPIGIIYTGNAFDATDEAWLSAAGERVKKYELEAGGQPDHVLFQSWNDKPDFVLPETKQFTFTNFIDSYFTDKSSLGYRREGPGANLALGKPVRVSNQISDQAGAFAVDGDLGTLWGSGGGPPQWIQIDLGANYSIQAVRLTTSQYPAGVTVHRVLGKGPGTNGEFRLLYTFTGDTTDGQTLTYTPPQPIQGIQFIRVETTVSPSWVAWREIEIVAGE